MRTPSQTGLRDLETIGSYLALQNIQPDIILSSCALRAQITTDTLAKKINFTGPIQYMDELYLTRPEMTLNILSTQDDIYQNIFIIGHNPTLTELVHIFTDNTFGKFPTLGILAIELPIDTWNEIENIHTAKIDFFIFPKQFKYYMPKHIRETL